MALLPKSFYLSEDVVYLAHALLGKRIVSKIDGVETSGIIVETEAYRAPDDKASHAYNNRRTARTETMFGEGGHAYVYLCYGIHEMFNVVTAPQEIAHAVLIRAVQPEIGIEIMRRRKNRSQKVNNLLSGPGKLTSALGINRIHNGCCLYAKSSLIYIEEGIHPDKFETIASPRVGIDYAEECIDWPWRFRIKDSKWVSPAK